MKALTFLLLLVPFVAIGQLTYGPHVLRGVVVESTTNLPLPGVNVEVASPNKSTVTDKDGRFVIESPQSSITISVSFIGFVTQTRVIHAQDTTVIKLVPDEALLETDRYIKTSLSAGYYGDIAKAPAGFIVNWNLQSIGKTVFNTNTGFKYWKEKRNEGVDALLSETLYLPKVGGMELIFGYKTIDYEDDFFNLEQTRLMLSIHTRHSFVIDAGSGYNTLKLSLPEQSLDKEKYFSGIIGVSKVFSGFSVIRNAGLRASVDYGADHLFYEAGAYKWIVIPKFSAVAVMARYYNYDTFDGILVSLRISLFSTEYYCCSSMAMFAGDLAALR